MRIETIVVGPIQTNCYLAWQEEEGGGFLVDPGADAETIVQTVRRFGVTVRMILLTHSHFDHILALADMQKAVGAQVAVFESEAGELEKEENTAAKAFGLKTRISPCHPEILLRDGDQLNLAGETVTVLHTPGHTVGSVCFDTGSVLFSGDTLFEDSCGRCDLPGGDQRQMLASLRRLHDLKGDRVVYPGHGPSTTLSRERQVNGAMLYAVRSAQ